MKFSNGAVGKNFVLEGPFTLCDLQLRFVF